MRLISAIRPMMNARQERRARPFGVDEEASDRGYDEQGGERHPANLLDKRACHRDRQHDRRQIVDAQIDDLPDYR